MIPLKYTIRSLAARRVTSLMTIFGTALVVWASVLAFGLAAGLDRTLDVSSDPLDLIVMRKGATSETSSVVNESAAREIAALAGIETDRSGRPLCSGELLVVINTPRRAAGGSANLMVRGVTPIARALRPDFQIVEGRDLGLGLREAVASRAIAQRFEGAGLGETLKVFDGQFRIVGLFEDGDSAAESEVWTDLRVLGQASQRTGFLSTVQLRAKSDEALERLSGRITDDEQFGLEAHSEDKYFADQQISGTALKIVGWIIAGFLVVGSAFAVANTMYGAVASRSREIGTLRALGFEELDVLVAFLVEALILCLLGGILGCLGTLPFNGLSTGTANWVTFTEIAFSFYFGPKVLFLGAALAIAMGLVGGFFPALRSTRMKTVDALREI